MSGIITCGMSLRDCGQGSSDKVKRVISCRQTQVVWTAVEISDRESSCDRKRVHAPGARRWPPARGAFPGCQGCDLSLLSHMAANEFEFGA
jgi:hypothetical protein